MDVRQFTRIASTVTRTWHFWGKIIPPVSFTIANLLNILAGNFFIAYFERLTTHKSLVPLGTIFQSDERGGFLRRGRGGLIGPYYDAERGH